MTMAASFTVTTPIGKWRWLCLILAWLATADLVLLPLINTAMILFPHLLDVLPADMTMRMSRDMSWSAATPLPYRIGIFFAEAVPTALSLWAIWSLRQLFLGYARGDVFSEKALRYLRWIAIGLLASELADALLATPLDSLLASWPLGPGKRAISLGFGTNDIGQLFSAGIAFVIARVMAEARRIAADSAEII